MIRASAYAPLLRAPLAPQEQQADLLHEPYAANQRLQDAYDNNPPLRAGESGEAVSLLQQALLSDGILLPVSTQQGREPPDGAYGPETAAGVRQFQGHHGLTVDGVAGRETLGQIDALAGSQETLPEPEEEAPTGLGLGPEGATGEYAQSLGPEAEGLAPGLTPGTSAETIIAVLERLDEWTLHQLSQSRPFIAHLYGLMSPSEFGRAAACFCLVVPAGVQHPVEAKREALRIMGTQMCGDKQVARRAIDLIRGVVIPANSVTTEIFPFHRLAGGHTMDGRPWESVRGIATGDPPYMYSALPEDNLLGIPCTATWTPTSGPNAGVPQHFGQDPEAYSSATHEFAHSLHMVGLTDSDRAIIQSAFDRATRISNLAPTNGQVWVDGPRGCYASLSVQEFFAQLSNAYLGTNAGSDLATGYPRHNGKLWVLTHEPEVYAILERIYAGGELEGTNPVSDPLATPAPQAAPQLQGIG